MNGTDTASHTAEKGFCRLDDFTEELHDWSISGEEPLLASRELRYVLDRQEERLKRRGFSMEQKIDHTGDEIRGKLERKGESIDASVLYREAVRRTTLRKNGRVLKEEKEPITFYATLLEKRGFSDFACTCPNCGNTALVSEMRDGCPYCKTVFEIVDVWPVFSSWYSVPGIVERATLIPKLKKNLSIIFACVFALVTIAAWRAHPDYVWWGRLLVSLFVGAVGGGMATFACYMLYSLRLLGKIFFEAGRAVPLLKGLRTNKKVEEIIKTYEPDFSYPLFEGRLVSLLRAIAYTEDRSRLSIYEGKEDLSFLDPIIDMQYRGVLQLLSSRVSDGVIRLKLKAFMTDLRYEGRLKRRDENFIISIEKDIDAHTDPGFNLCSVKCKGCGASFDALHLKKCTYCGRPYNLIHDDWMITSIRQA